MGGFQSLLISERIPPWRWSSYYKKASQKNWKDIQVLDARYRTLRFRYGSRVSFFQELTTLLNWFLFDNWDHVVAVMFAKLRVDTS